MKIVAVSDLHGNLPAIPPCDLLLLAGDLTPVTNHAIRYQAQWLDTEFRAWLRSLAGVRQVVGIAGNHDFIFQQAPELVPADLPWVYLQDALTEFDGLRIWGTPWQPWFFDWAFNAQPDELPRIWALMPDQLDIIVVHGPPHGYGDGVPAGGGLRRCGCRHLLARIEEIRPRLVVYGHIHPGAGVYPHRGITLANVSLLNDSYRVVHAPSVFVLDADHRKTVVQAAASLAPGEYQEIAWEG